MRRGIFATRENHVKMIPQKNRFMACSNECLKKARVALLFQKNKTKIQHKNFIAYNLTHLDSLPHH